MKSIALYEVTFFGNVCGIIDRTEFYAQSLRELKIFIKKYAERTSITKKCGNIMIWSADLNKIWTAPSLSCNFKLA